MANNRCPMCGKNNPPEAEQCQYCQARLTPLHSGAPVTPPEGDGEIDWLRDLRGESDSSAPVEPAAPPSPEEPAAASEAEGDAPDWLARIRQRTQEEEDALSQIGPAPKIDESLSNAAENMPDWLRELPLAGSDATGVPAWMQDLRPVGEEPATTPAAAQTPVEPELPAPLAADGDNEAWLRSLGQWAVQPQGEAEASAPQAEEPAPEEALPAEIPAWLTSLNTETLPGAPTEPENQDWLAALNMQAVESPSPQEEGTASEAEPPAEGRESTGLTGWLNTLQEQTAIPTEEGTSAPLQQEESSPAAAMDWPSFTEEATPPLQAAAEEITPAPGVPDWLASAGQPAPIQEPAPDSAAVPDWLKAFEATPAAPTETPRPREKNIPSQEESPDWLHDFSALGSAAGELQVAQPGEGVPDWLTSFNGDAKEESLPPAIEPSTALPAENLPEWLRAIEPQQPAPGTPAFGGSDQPEPVAPFSGEEIPTWVSSSEQLPSQDENFELPAFTIETEEASAAETSPLADGEALPQWIAEESTPAAEPVEEGSPGIEEAQLPTWLQAMRPLEAAVQSRATSLDEERIEKSGPLAGMSGVLPGEDLVTQYRRPPSYSARLRISDKQQVLANLLESVVAEETLSQPLQAEPTQAPQLIVRALVGVLLIAAILLALLVKPFIGIQKGATAPGTPANQVFRLIEELPAGAPVLVVVDYEAGLSGEMKTASLPVIQHLMSRKARIILVSTQAVGAVLGESLLKEAARPTRGAALDYAIPQSSANLGYLVGGAMALRELSAPMDAAHPRPLQAALPAPLRAEGGWDGLVLKNLSQVTDFKRVVLLTDSMDNGRAWIEQVQPALARKVPLIVVSSAQSAPLLQSYQSSGQVSAIISGIVGGRVYEEATRRPAAATAYWNAYQVGIGIVLILILLGGILMSISALLSRSKKQNQAKGS